LQLSESERNTERDRDKEKSNRLILTTIEFEIARKTERKIRIFNSGRERAAAKKRRAGLCSTSAEAKANFKFNLLVARRELNAATLLTLEDDS
jgi:hypothetical protein